MEKDELKKYTEKIKIRLKLRGCSERTIESYLFFLKPFLKSINNLDKVNLDQVESFHTNLIDRYSNKSRALAVSSLRFFFKRIVDRPNIYVKLEAPKKEKTLPIVLSTSEVKKLIKAPKFIKTKLIIKMLYASGLRVSELVNLTSKDLDFQEKIGWVRKGKGKKDRLFKIADSISKQLQKYLKKNPNNKYIFSRNKPLTTRNIQIMIKRATKRANINKKVTPHTLRHSFATHLLEKGENLIVIQDLLGHANLETTRIYTHINQEQIKKVKSPLDNL